MPGLLAITHAAVVGRDRILEDHTVVCEGDRITEIFPSQSTGGLAQGLLSRPDVNVTDAKGMYLVPGFIDLHIHGLAGKLASNGPDDLAAMCRELPRFGVTAFLPTVTPNEEECKTLANLAGAKTPCAEVLGFFLEGHFLKLTGAIRGMKSEYTPERVGALKNALGNKRAVFGISPEIPGILSLLPLMTEGGVPAFITHTMASYEETEKAIAAGARHATHFYDVFPYPGEQEPGVRGCGAVEAVMANPGATVDFILDGEHVHPGAVKMALACKGMDKVCLITDANLNAGMESGVYRGISGTDVIMEYKGGPAREYHEGGKPGGLTGSGLTLDLALKNAVELLGLSLPAAAALVSHNAAKVLGLEHERGVIEKGYRADFSILDNDFSIRACYIAGKLNFKGDD